MHTFRFSLSAAIAGLALIAFAPAQAQQGKVEYVPPALSSTVTMIKGRGGNIAVIDEAVRAFKQMVDVRFGNARWLRQVWICWGEFWSHN